MIIFLSLFQVSFSQTGNTIYMEVNASSASSSTQIIGTATEVLSITCNEKEVTVNTKIAVIKGINEIIVAYKSTVKDCSKLLMNSKASYIDMSYFDSSQCTSFLNAFYGCSSLTSIKFGGKFDTSNAKDMTSMFYSCGNSKSRISLDLSNFDTSKVTSMKSMFGKTSFIFLNLSSFDTSQVQTMQTMFSSSSRLISLDLSSFDTTKVTSMNQMFYDCMGIISLDISSFRFDVLTDSTKMFSQMKGYLKFSNDNPNFAKIKDAISDGKLVSNCKDPCFTNTVNKFYKDDNTCYESCTEDQVYSYEYDNECVKKCPSGTEERPKGSYICVDIIDCSKSYYNYEKTESIDEVPEGYYCNNETTKTIDKCPEKCKTCELESVQNDICITCNEDKLYYEAEGYADSQKYIDCFINSPEGYYFENSKFKKCYETCKSCSELGNEKDNKCIECKSDMIKELNSNCYNKCQDNQKYYFDDSNNYHCTDIMPEGYKLIVDKNKYTKDCKDDPPFIYQHEDTCLENCPEKYHAPNDDKICVVALECDFYYNYEYNGCLIEIPEGFFCNSTEKKTIDKCKTKCKTCNLESFTNDLCIECNEIEGYYKFEDKSINNNNYIECLNVIPEGYYLDKDNIIKKCYKTCKRCESLGNNKEHFCKECYDGYTLNNTNCYKICDYHYYFDENFEYFCTNNEQCPEKKNKLYVDKNECVEKCIAEYKFEFENKCYKSCPINSYYNYEQTNCISNVPEGFYLNDTQTIDKCNSKCKECDLNSVNGNICISCNNSLGYYKKEDDIRINQYYDCFTGELDGYYLDISNNDYKKCYKTCKKCNELGNVKDNKCVECFSNSTLNGSNCYQICEYYHYFDNIGEYHCTKDKGCINDRSKLFVDKNECVKECINDYKFEFDNKCYKECPDGTYYNYTQDGCIDFIPPGYYLNDSLKRTIDKCDIKCENECTLDERNIVLCKECNNKMKYYKKEDEEEKNGYYDCYTGEIEKYFLDNNEYKKCYESCKHCNELGDNLNHKCTDCTSEYSQNGTNCYQICKYLYYFDLNKIHHCTENDECPSDFPNKIVNENKCVEKCIEGKYIKLIVDKKECVEKCIDEYKFEFDNKCYKECPDGTYYNSIQHVCIDYIPS